jgi:hypothetical protein
MAAAFSREPRVPPAVFAELPARPARRLRPAAVQHHLPRMSASVSRWFAAEIEAGRIRELPPLPLMQQLIRPLVLRVLLRPSTEQLPDVPVPPLDEVCDTFAAAFLRAVAR